MASTPKITFTSSDLMSVPQAAKELNVHFVTVYRWIHKGKLTPFRAGGFIFVLVDEVRALKESNNKCRTGS